MKSPMTLLEFIEEFSEIKLTPTQMEHLLAMEKNPNVVVTLGRQCGKTAMHKTISEYYLRLEELKTRS